MINRFAIIGCALTAMVSSASAQGSASEAPGLSHQQGDAILNELRQIRQILKGLSSLPVAPAAANGSGARITLKLDSFNRLGASDAPVTIVEFTDYQCPFCQQFHLAVFTRLAKNYIDMGKLRFYSRDFPLSVHENAARAAQAGRCAGDQDRFWEMRDRLQSNSDKLTLTNILRYAKDLGMNGGTFKSCLQTEKYKEAVAVDIAQARSIGASATPTFIVGKSTAEGVEGQLIIGAQPYEVFEEQITRLLP